MILFLVLPVNESFTFKLLSPHRRNKVEYFLKDFDTAKFTLNDLKFEPKLADKYRCGLRMVVNDKGESYVRNNILDQPIIPEEYNPKYYFSAKLLLKYAILCPSRLAFTTTLVASSVHQHS